MCLAIRSLQLLYLFQRSPNQQLKMTTGLWHPSVMRCMVHADYMDKLQFTYRKARGVDDATILLKHRITEHLDNPGTYCVLPYSGTLLNRCPRPFPGPAIIDLITRKSPTPVKNKREFLAMTLSVPHFAEFSQTFCVHKGN